jgi:hypothetical protein
MNRIARILTAALIGLMVCPLACAGGSEATAATGALAAQAAAPPVQAGGQLVLRPYYVVPFFPFLWPVPPGQPASAPVQAPTPQTTPYPAYPFVIWLPVLQPVLPAATVGIPVPAAVKPQAGQAVTEPAVAAPPTSPQTPTTEAQPTLQEVSGPPNADQAHSQPAGELGLPSRQAEPAPEQPLDAASPASPVVTKEMPARQRVRPDAAPTVKAKPAATRAGAAKPAQKDTANKRKLCWKDGKLDVCK